MPSGRIHAASSAFLAIPACFVTLGATGDWTLSASCGLGCLAGIALTPDLDQEGISSSEYWLIKWTLGVGFLWTMLWYPYARLCKHRSPLSHWPLLGTIGRLLYLSILPGIALFYGWKPPAIPLVPLYVAIAGLAASDALHWFLDTNFSEHGHRRKSRH